jgi:hypothetical protein
MRNYAALLLAMGVLLLSGCEPTAPALVPVKGKLTVNGRSLKGATLVFTPDVAKGGHGPQSFAVTADDGGFTLKTNDGVGAVAGWHRVTVAPSADDVELMTLMEKFLDPERSGIVREVKAGVANVIDLSLEATP